MYTYSSMSGKLVGKSTDVFPTKATVGDLAYQTDTGKNYVYDGTSWVRSSEGGDAVVTTEEIVNASLVGKSVLTAADAAAILLLLSAQPLIPVMTTDEAVAGTSLEGRQLSAFALRASVITQIKNKSQIWSLTTLPTPATATLTEIATKVNAIIAALKA